MKQKAKITRVNKFNEIAENKPKSLNKSFIKINYKKSLLNFYCIFFSFGFNDSSIILL